MILTLDFNFTTKKLVLGILVCDFNAFLFSEFVEIDEISTYP
jgi:hypothetical protein